MLRVLLVVRLFAVLAMCLRCWFCSPHETPFEDGTFKLTMEFSEEYPNKPPVVRFVSKMFHPNGKYTLYFWYVYELRSSSIIMIM